MSESYDYVVLGAGSAGCAVAGRLSEDPSVSVALVEAGPPSVGLAAFENPALFSRLQKSSYDWDLQSEPEPELGRRRAYLPRGRALGGTSAINTMLYVRGNRADYDGWAGLGADGWDYESVLEDFRRSEDNERGGDEFHGVGGPLSVSDPHEVDPLLSAWLAAAMESGQPATEDFNGARQEGVGVYQLTQREGLRRSSAKAFLEPASERENLTVLHSTLALRLLWTGLRATGVEVECLGSTRTLGVRAEVILAAGAYQSPQLLQLSGVGPRRELSSVGIEPVLDLPAVGRNLQDHAGCLLAFRARAGGEPEAEPTNWVEVGGFMRSRDGLDAPDLQLHAALGISSEEGLGPSSEKGLSFGPYVARPASRGWVGLRNADPHAKPRIQHNFLVEPGDRSALRDGLRISLAIAEQPALREHLEPRAEAARAGLVPAGESDEAMDAFINRTAFSFYHPCGTCAIGEVTDPELRVLGLEGVRVADASVMPRLITGNTNAPAIMIGERAAALIGG